MRSRLPVLLLLLGMSTPAWCAPPGYEVAKARHDSLVKSLSLAERTHGQELLAETRDPRALEVLAGDYARPRSPQAQSRHALASLITRAFDDEAFVDGLAAMRKRFHKARDAWLWYRTLVVHGRHRGPDELLRVARKEKNAFLRAAAIEALRTLGRPEVVPLALDLLADLPSRGAERAVLLESLSAALRAEGEAADSDILGRALAALVGQFAEETTSARSRTVLARDLAVMLGTGDLYLDAASWRTALDGGRPEKSGTPVRLRAASIGDRRAFGRRICYVIDAGQGAGAPATDADLDRVLGTSQHEGAQHLTRLALMGEALRRSLGALTPDQQFAVVFTHVTEHGAEAGRLPADTGFRRATSENVARTLAALRALPTGGSSDPHGGLQFALRLAGDDLVRDDEHIEPAALLEGCDTIFLFDQGAPTADAYVRGGVGGGPEGLRTLASGMGIRGLYADPAWFWDDAQRMMLFRKVAVRCITFGEPWAELPGRFVQDEGGSGLEADTRRGVADVLLNGWHSPRYDDAQARYEAWLQRPSYWKRAKGRELFAQTRDIRALDILSRSYGAAEDPRPEVQGLIVDVCCDAFHDTRDLPLYSRWRGHDAQRKDAWLWYRALRVATDHFVRDVALRTAAKAGDPFLQAAAIRALVSSRTRDLLPRIPDWVKRLRRFDAGRVERIVPVEAMATVLAAYGTEKDGDAYKEAALALLDEFDDRGTPARTKLTIVRNLAAGLHEPPDGLDKAPWVREVRAGGSGGGGGDARYGPTFAGLRASGTRICYVIDFSDSMLTPLKPGERKRARVVTGADGRPERPEDAISWADVHNRFDLARELLIYSLRDLKPTMQFSVIWFGSDADTLHATPDLMAATPNNISRAVKELRAIKPGAPGSGQHKTGVKWGALRGETNLHGGMVRAFTRTSDKALTGTTYVSEKGLMEGCDTIYLLSDGAPTTDDYRRVDKRDPEDHAVKDRETSQATADVPELEFPGPYGEVSWPYLVHDLARRNLFRQVEILCVGIGEADMRLLERLAHLGLGKARQIGKE